MQVETNLVHIIYDMMGAKGEGLNCSNISQNEIFFDRNSHRQTAAASLTSIEKISVYKNM